jgi:hypothetical protein
MCYQWNRNLGQDPGPSDQAFEGATWSSQSRTPSRNGRAVLGSRNGFIRVLPAMGRTAP